MAAIDLEQECAQTANLRIHLDSIVAACHSNDEKIIILFLSSGLLRSKNEFYIFVVDRKKNGTQLEKKEKKIYWHDQKICLQVQSFSRNVKYLRQNNPTGCKTRSRSGPTNSGRIR